MRPLITAAHVTAVILCLGAAGLNLSGAPVPFLDDPAVTAALRACEDRIAARGPSDPGLCEAERAALRESRGVGRPGAPWSPWTVIAALPWVIFPLQLLAAIAALIGDRRPH